MRVERWESNQGMGTCDTAGSTLSVVTRILGLFYLLFQTFRTARKRVELAAKVMLNRKEDVRPTKLTCSPPIASLNPSPLFGALSALRTSSFQPTKNFDFAGAIG